MRLGRKKFLTASVVFAFAICIWTFFIWRDDISTLLASVSAYLRDSISILSDVPLIFYSIAIAILPIVFLPVTPVYIVASARCADESYLTVLLYCWLGAAINIAVSYFIARRFGDVLRRRLERRSIHIPVIPDYEQYEFILLLRLIPGNPLTVQNYVLGGANVDFSKYIIASIPIQFIQVAAYVYFGEGIFDGMLSKFILGTSFLFVLAIIARMVDKRFGHKIRRMRRNCKCDDGASEEQ